MWVVGSFAPHSITNKCYQLWGTDFDSTGDFASRIPVKVEYSLLTGNKTDWRGLIRKLSGLIS